MNSESLNVFREGRLFGRIRKEGLFNLVFQYDKAWLDDDSAPAVSISCPRTGTAPKPARPPPFFQTSVMKAKAAGNRPAQIIRPPATFRLNYWPKTKNHEGRREVKHYIHLTKISLKKSKILSKTYLYGYGFRKGTNAHAKAAFIEHLKSFYLLDKEDEKLQLKFERFIQEPLAKLKNKIHNINCIVSPQSRSMLNRIIVQTIEDITNIPSSNYLSFELLKRNINDIKLEVDKFERAYKGTMPDVNYQKILEKAQSYITKLRSDPYFSISIIPGHIRRYVTPFLNFPDEKRIKPAITGSKILLIDDIETTGATVLECCKTVHKLGQPKNITILTMLGNNYRALGPVQSLKRISHL